MNNDLFFSSASDCWATPDDLFQKLNKYFKFDLDVCANKLNAKCKLYFTEDDNGLQKDWLGTCFMNPPYGRGISEWVKKAYNTSIEQGNTIVCLLPARCDTRWWHDYCVHGEITFIKGRLKFGNAKNCAPFPSAIVVFRPTVSQLLGCM